jgi:S1-C subfamily serine protease
MRRVFQTGVSLLLALVLLSPAQVSVGAFSESLYAKVSRSLRLLVLEKGPDQFAICTATAIAPQRYLTAGHCVSQVDHLELQFPPAEVTVQKVDTQADLALVVSEEESYSPALTLAGSKPEFGTEVVSIGYHMGSNPPASFFGRVMGGAFNQRRDLLWVDASGNVGSSGGAIVTMDGRLVGITLGGVNPPSIATYAATVETIRRFLK